MARIQILELPMEHVGEHSRTPFAIVIDQYDSDFSVSPALRDEIAQQTGAVGVVFSQVPLEVV